MKVRKAKARWIGPVVVAVLSAGLAACDGNPPAADPQPVATRGGFSGADDDAGLSLGGVRWSV